MGSRSRQPLRTLEHGDISSTERSRRSACDQGQQTVQQGAMAVVTCCGVIGTHLQEAPDFLSAPGDQGHVRKHRGKAAQQGHDGEVMARKMRPFVGDDRTQFLIVERRYGRARHDDGRWAARHAVGRALGCFHDKHVAANGPPAHQPDGFTMTARTAAEPADRQQETDSGDHDGSDSDSDRNQHG
jgi:hypothetical protein